MEDTSGQENIDEFITKLPADNDLSDAFELTGCGRVGEIPMVH